MIAIAGACSFSPAAPSSPPSDASSGATADAAAVDAAVRCDFDDVELMGHRYEQLAQPQSWAQARDTCRARGGYLLKIDSADENAAAELLLVGFFHVWIGLHDRLGDDQWMWADGTPLAGYTNFDVVSNAEDCVGLSSVDGRCDTRPCNAMLMAVCECERPEDALRE